MRGRPAQSITVNDSQRDALEQIIRRQTNPQHLVRRARIILMAAGGQTNLEIAAFLHVNREMVGIWRRRWAEAQDRLDAAASRGERDVIALIHEVLSDAPRPGTPAKFHPEQIAQIITLACTDPSDSGRPITHWTPRDLADEAIRRGIVETISPQSVERFLKAS